MKMTEGSTEDGNFLVRVRAQVMTRDDSTGGWVPMGGGGLSNVSVRKRIISEEDTKPEYLICGKRISDQTIVLSCTIKKDFQYNKVMPTFHHWKTGDKKFGLTFQTAADARAFDKGVRNAVEDLMEGIGYGHSARSGDMGDDEVFMTLELPVDSRSSSGSSSESGIHAASLTSSPYGHHLHRMHFMRPSRTMPGSNGGSSGLPSSLSAGDIWTKEESAEPYSYVQFSKAEHEYCYPAVETLKPAFKKPAEPPLLPSKGWRAQQCRHCLDSFVEEENRAGSCEYGPDRTLRCVDNATCFSCAQCMLYHCMSDAEGDFPQHPCSCDAADEHCRRRWTGLALLSLFVPCLWCYLPLRACHHCAVGCGYCGGKHEPALT